MPMSLRFLLLAVLFRGIEIVVVRPCGAIDGQWAGATTHLTLIDLKREAFEKWRTGCASAYAVTLFVTVFGPASIAVKALIKEKDS